ncbi:hypothetical protein J2X35_001130 [Mesorhizobium sp. BE184]|nr:hypothetical protein [Mesorhizobium sp. BE184]
MSDWQDIATAPKDGSLVFLRNGEIEYVVPFWWSVRKRRWETRLLAVCRSVPGWWSKDADPPTEWRPPAPHSKEIEG